LRWYKLVFKQNQPIHIGSARWGVVNETEIFIPGWTMWGALTKAYNQYSNCKLSDNQELFETITCFYPFFKEKSDNVLFPKYKNGLLYLGEEYSEDKFRYEFTDTFVSTAIVPGTRSAKDESLHEIEILLPKGKKEGKSLYRVRETPKEASIYQKKTCKKEKESLYWVGVLGIDNDLPNFFKNGLKIFIGGDIKYGLGELELLDPEPKNNDFLEGWNINNNGYLNLSNDKNIKQFLEFSPEIKFEGELKLLAEFDFTKNTPKVKKAGYFINIGSKIINGITSEYKLVKGKFERV
jgi:hypothetical protein